MYQDLDNYEKNLTVRSNGTTLDETRVQEDIRLCYIEDTKGNNYQSFIRECRDKDNTTKDVFWVLASNAASNENDNIDVMKSASNFEESRVIGLIMLSNVYPRELDDSKADEQNKFVHPSFLAITNAKNHKDTFSKYSWNKGDSTQNTVFKAKHIYTERCYLIAPFTPYLLTLSGYYLFLAIAWCIFCLCVRKSNSHNIQKWLTVIPITKFLWLI